MPRRVECLPLPCLAFAVFACVISVAPPSARAESVELRWETGAAIEGCPTAAEVEAVALADGVDGARWSAALADPLCVP